MGHGGNMKEQSSKYMSCVYNHAVEVRKLQNIVMPPGSWELSGIAIKHLHDCPITRDDVYATDDIFGPNLGSLKGQTACHPNPHIRSGIHGVPPEIMKVPDL